MKKNVVSTVRKLLRVARRGATEQERQTAREAADALMKKHRIELSDEDSDRCEKVVRGAAAAFWSGALLSSLARVNECLVLRGYGDDPVVAGSPEAVENTVGLYRQLHAEILHQLLSRWGRFEKEALMMNAPPYVIAGAKKVLEEDVKSIWWHVFLTAVSGEIGEVLGRYRCRPAEPTYESVEVPGVINAQQESKARRTEEKEKLSAELKALIDVVGDEDGRRFYLIAYGSGVEGAQGLQWNWRAVRLLSAQSTIPQSPPPPAPPPPKAPPQPGRFTFLEID
jgi:hypothetical protein